MRERFVCIHGHFYQPPRENPWLDEIERQPSAHPFRNWNERIAAECYAPNAFARILRGGSIAQIVSNFERISFNIGPSLLSWMERAETSLYRAVISADARSRERFGGFGSALAQVHGHLIMPLANARDKRTQVLWGKADFEKRFGRSPEGMWLSEAAVNTETLECLAEAGIRFTLLSPRQAAFIRPPGGDWSAPSEDGPDPKKAYRVSLPSGRSIAVFFYDGPVSQAVAFEHLLADGDKFLRRLLGSFDESSAEPQIAHAATDGESYGHHHRFGEMALAYALNALEESPGISLTNYAQFLHRHPPIWEARVVENSSWSCAHGIERWRSNCGCRTGGEDSWSQSWRAPLRNALNSLRDFLALDFENIVGEVLHDPWAARDEFIGILLDPQDEVKENFFNRHSKRMLSAAEKVRVLSLLESQKNAMTMFTSCGWFFSELSGIETVQLFLYADRAAALSKAAGGPDRLDDFLERLSEAKSSRPECGDGRTIFQREARTARFGAAEVLFRAVSRELLETAPLPSSQSGFSFSRSDERRLQSSGAVLSLGRASLKSVLTGAVEELVYCVLSAGGGSILGGARPWIGLKDYESCIWAASSAFSSMDFKRLEALIDEQFPDSKSFPAFLDRFPSIPRERTPLTLQNSADEINKLLARLPESSPEERWQLQNDFWAVRSKLPPEAELALAEALGFESPSADSTKNS